MGFPNPKYEMYDNLTFASRPWALVTDNGVYLLTEIYVIYMLADTSCFAMLWTKIQVLGSNWLWRHTEGRKARKYIRMLSMVIGVEVI